MTRTLVLLSLLALLAVQIVPVGAEEKAPPPGTYRIGAGDVLEVSVWKNEQLSRTVIVRPDGMISLPLLNDVQAAGSTPLQLRDILAKKLAEYIPAAEVSVIVNRVRSFSISVIGSVTKPGHFNLSAPTTVLEALAMAGGLTEFASRKSIFVVRAEPNGNKKLPFNYNKAISENDQGENFLLQAGDVLVVP
jgi:polysaccharide export outer membrane protein